MRIRFVHFAPSPFLGARVPIGALLESTSGIRFIPNKGIRCLSRKQSWVVNATQEILSGDLSDFDNLPPSVSNMSFLGEMMPLESKIDDPVKWIAGLFGQHDGVESESKHRGGRRESHGWRWIEDQGLDRHVSRTFRPGEHGFESAAALRLSPIKQYAGNEKKYLLLEPLAPALSSFENSLKKVRERFSEYKTLLAPEENKFKYAAYLVPGGRESDRASSKDFLGNSVDFFFDTAHQGSKAALKKRVFEFAA